MKKAKWKIYAFWIVLTELVGVTKASELGKNRIKTSIAMMNALRKLPADDRATFLSILKDLAKSGGSALRDAILDAEKKSNTW